MANQNGFRIVDGDGQMLAMYAHQSEVKSYINASYDREEHMLRKAEDGKTIEVVGSDGEVKARVIGDWKDE